MKKKKAWINDTGSSFLSLFEIPCGAFNPTVIALLEKCETYEAHLCNSFQCELNCLAKLRELD